jgi:DNA-binding MarR family transcriptional regulator
MTTTAPTADARTLALAHYAARGVLEHVLSRHGMTFQQQITLRAVVTAAAPLTPTELVTHVQGSLKADPADIRATIDALLAKKLIVKEGAYLRPAEVGREVLAAAATDTVPFAARIWGGMPTEDLAAAGRVLALVAERANAELAALTA